MKKSWLLSAFVAMGICASAVAQDNPVLMTINGKEVTKSEFEYIYNKNNKQQVDLKSLDEYIPLFINYKLKVDAAEQAGIDTTAAFRQEFDGYRRELAKPYLTDAETEERLLREAYEFNNKNVEISHILVTVAPNASAEEKAAALAKTQEAADKAKAGEDFAALALQYSDDPGSKNRGGYLSYIRGGRLIYPFEKVAFNMQPGEISEPVETRFGYHVIKVHDVRADRGERLGAHIFIAVPQGASTEVDAQKKAEAEAIYNDLMAGADFVTMAREKSNDQSNAMNGGELPWVASGDLIKELEDALYSLEVGEIATPVRTQFGYHIVRLNDTRDSKSYEEMRPELSQRIMRDERANMGRETLLNNLKKQYNYTADATQITNAVTACGSVVDSAFIASLGEQDIIFATYAYKQITAKDIAAGLKSRRLAPNLSSQDVLTREVERIVSGDLLDMEMNTLESKYPEYRNLLNEYRDGMLLFEISNQEVWDKATRDTKGLEKYFKKNRKSYTWDRPHYKGVVVECANDSIAGEVKKLMKKNQEGELMVLLDTTFNNDSVTNVVFQHGLYVEGDNQFVDEFIFGGEPAPRQETLPVVFVSGKLLKNPESYTDVRGKVTADYQEYLEKVWITKLNKAAKVEINEDVLKTIK